MDSGTERPVHDTSEIGFKKIGQKLVANWSIGQLVRDEGERTCRRDVWKSTVSDDEGEESS